jgi:hypothetical protein
MFEHLDDPEPFDPTNETRAAVQRRASNLRRRRVLAPSVVALVLLTGLVGVVAHRSDGQRVVAAAPQQRAPLDVSGTPTLRSSIEVDRHVVAAGGTLHATLVIDNPTGHAVDLRGAQCRPKWALGLARPGKKPTVLFSSDCLPGPWHIPTGRTRYPFALKARVDLCTNSSPTATEPQCLPGNVMPPLAPGTYKVQFASLGAIKGFPVPQPVTITVR